MLNKLVSSYQFHNLPPIKMISNLAPACPFDFTLREIQIIQFSKENFSCKEIADKLFISENTVRKHRQNIITKIGGSGKSDFRIFVRNYPPPPPPILRSDNGPDFTSKDLDLWCKDNEITFQFIQPKKPMQNGLIERFNRLYPEAVLDAYLFLI